METKEKIRARGAKWRAENPEKEKARKAEYYRKNSEKIKAYHVEYNARNTEKYREYKLKAKYGLTLSEFEMLWEKCDGRCNICYEEMEKRTIGKRSIRMVCVDHDHSTGKVRGLLCDFCNKGIGMLMDDPKIVSKALSYLIYKGDAKIEEGDDNSEKKSAMLSKADELIQKANELKDEANKL